MENVIENKVNLEVKKSALQAETAYDFDLIKQPHPYLIPVHLIKSETGINFEFQVGTLIKLTEIKNWNDIDALRTLLDALKLYELYKVLKFDLNPNNLYQDLRLHVMVAFRDVYAREDVVSEESFVKEVLCLLGSLLQTKYSYEQLKDSGTQLLVKSRKTKPFANLTTIDEIEIALDDALMKAKKYQDEKLITVNKNGYRQITWIGRIAVVIALVFIALSSFLHFYQNSFLRQTHAGLTAYLRSDFVETIDQLSPLDLERMDHMTMYTLAVAYIRTEALTSEQRDNILTGVTPASNERVLEFWVHLAQENYEQAIDTARLLDNDEYLIYGYMKLRDAVERDPSLTGAEREAELERIDRQLNQFRIQHEEALGD